MISIAMFNNKGGVGKTTLLCNLASYLSKFENKRVLVIDADPQCNCSTYVLDNDTFYDLYYDRNGFSIEELVRPLQRGKGFINQDGFSVIKSQEFGFSLLPGNPKFAMQEDFLSSDWADVAGKRYRGIQTTMVFFHVLSLCQNNYDYVFFDMGPSLGAINRSILLACDYFVIPMSTDIFSVLALSNIGKSIDIWRDSFNKAMDDLDYREKEEIAKSLNGFRTSCSIKFLGYVEQQYITKMEKNGGQRAVKAYDKILKRLPGEIDKHVVELINGSEKKEVEPVDYRIGSIPNYYSLIPMSQNAHKPVFVLGGTDGIVGAHYQKVSDYKELIKRLTDHFLSNIERIREKD